MRRRLGGARRERLLHEDQALIGTVTWADYFRAFGVDYRGGGPGTGLSSTFYEPLVQAALAGRGVALGWAHLADGLVEAGILARVGTLSYRTGRRFWVVWPGRTPLSAQAERVRDALLGPVHGPG